MWHGQERFPLPERPVRYTISLRSCHSLKLLVTTLASAVARFWPDTASNAVDPGWVPTRMGGPSSPDDLRLGHLTQECNVSARGIGRGGRRGVLIHSGQAGPDHPTLPQLAETGYLKALFFRLDG